MRASSLTTYCLFLATALFTSCGKESSGTNEEQRETASPDESPLPQTASIQGATEETAATPAPEASEGIESNEESAAIGLANSTLHPLVYHMDERAAVDEVLQEFGPLTIDPSLIQQVGESTPKTNIIKVPDAALPWSSYWYPKREKDLFEARTSPMAKLDEYLKKNGFAKGAQAWEKEQYNAFAADWEGLCDAWAVASVLTREPKAKIREQGIDFLPSDLKALAIKYFEGYSSRIYGRRYQGSAFTDGQIQDLRPEAFHRLAEVVIGENQKPLIIDEDPGPEIWSKPVFRMSYQYLADPEHKNAVIVKAFPWMIRQKAEVSDAPTSLSLDLAAPEYQYRLFFEPGTFPLRVVAGEWIGPSINFHPDMVFLPGVPTNARQYNPSVRENHETLRKLLVKVGMLPE